MRTPRPRIALAILCCFVVIGCARRRKASTELVQPKIHFILHATDDEYSVFGEDFEDLKDEAIFNPTSVYGQLAATGEPAGPTTGGLFESNFGPLEDTASILIVGTNFDTRTTLEWVPSDTSLTTTSGQLSLDDMNGAWISENCIAVVPPSSPITDTNGVALDGYADIIARNPDSEHTDRFEGVTSLGHNGAWLYVTPGGLSVSSIALDAKLPSDMVIAPGMSGIGVDVVIANATADDIRLDLATLRFVSDTLDLNSYINAFADYRDPSSFDGDRSGSNPALGEGLQIASGSTTTLPFLLNVAKELPTTSALTEVAVSCEVSGTSQRSAGTFTATLSDTLFSIARSPLVRTDGGGVWSPSSSDQDAGSAGSVSIGSFTGSLTTSGTLPVVAAPTLGGSDASETTYTSNAAFPNTCTISGSDTLGVDLTPTGAGEIQSDTLTIAGSIVSALDTDGSAFDIQIGTEAAPAAIVVFNGASIVLAGQDDGVFHTAGSGSQGSYAGDGGSIVIYTQRFICVDSQIDLKAGRITGGPFSFATTVGSSGSLQINIVSGFTVQIATSTIDLDGADSSGSTGGPAGSLGITTFSSAVDVTLATNTVLARGGSSFGASVSGLPAYVTASPSAGGFVGGSGGSVVLTRDDTGTDNFGDITIIGGSYELTGGNASTVTSSDVTAGDGGSFLVDGGNAVVVANSDTSALVLSACGGTAGRFGGFGAGGSDSQGGDGGSISLGDSSAGAISLDEGSVLAALGGSSDDRATGLSGASGGDIGLLSGISVTVAGSILTQGGFARQDGDGSDSQAGDAGAVVVQAELDFISIPSSGLIWAVGGSCALYGDPRPGSDIDFSGSADISAGAGGNVTLTIAGGGTDADDGDVTIAGRVFSAGGHAVDSDAGSAGSGGAISVQCGTNGNNGNEGDLTVTGVVCASGGRDFFTGASEGTAGNFTALVDGGAVTWSGRFEAVGGNAGDFTLNANVGNLSLEADAACALSGDFDLDDDFTVGFRGRPINFTGTIAASSEQANSVSFSNIVEPSDGNAFQLSYAGTSWADVHSIASEYSVNVTGTITSNESFTSAPSCTISTQGTSGGSNTTDPDIFVSGTIGYGDTLVPTTGASIVLVHVDADLTDDANIDLSAGSLYGGSFSARIGSSTDDTTSVNDEGDINLNGAHMVFGSSFSCLVREGEITLPSTRTVQLVEDGATVTLTVGEHTSTAAQENISIAGAITAPSGNVTVDVSSADTDADADISITGSIDVSGDSTSADAGSITVRAQDGLTLSGALIADGADVPTGDRFGYGGTVTISDDADNSTATEVWDLSGSISVDGGGDSTTVTPGYFLEGGNGGLISIVHLADAEGETFTLATDLSADGGPSAHGPGGFGGVIAVSNLDGSTNTAGGELTLSGIVTCSGASSIFAGGGYGGLGGNIFYAGGEVIIAASASVDGGDGPAAGGHAGNISVLAVNDFSNGVDPLSGSGSFTAVGGDATSNGFAGNGGSIFLDNDASTASPGTSIGTDVSAGSGTVAGLDGVVYREP